MFQSALSPVMLLIFGVTAALVQDHLMFSNDSWWHLANGRVILQSGKIPTTEIFSHTAAGFPLLDHSWLSDVVFAALECLGGLRLVELFSLFLVALIARVVYANCLELGASGLGAIFGTLLAAITSIRLLIIRPHLFTMLFAALLFFWYLRYRKFGERTIYLFPALTILWSNLHGGFVLGIAFILAMALLEYVEARVASDGVAQLSRSRTLLWLGMLGAVTAMVHPFGYHQYISALSNTPLFDPIHLRIDEWLQPKWHEVPLLESAVMAALLAALFIRPLPPLFQIALLFGTIHLALSSWRHILLFSVFGVPILSSWISQTLSAGALKRRISAGTVRSLHRINLMLQREHGVSELVGLGFVAMGLFMVQRYSPAVMDSPAVKSRFPVEAAQWIKTHPSSDKLFNTYGWGGFLIYSLWPEKKVFIDSRMLPYKDKVFDEHFDVLLGKKGFEKILGRYQVGMLLIPVDSQLLREFLILNGWMVTYQDATAMVLAAH